MQKNEYMYDELGNNQGSEKEQFENDNNEVNLDFDMYSAF